MNTFVPNQRVKVIQSSNALLQESNTSDVGRLGIILAVDHPSAGLAGALTVVLDKHHNGLGELEPRVLRFLNPTQLEPA